MGFREAFSLLPSCLWGFIWSNTVELGGFRKEVCFSDEIQYPYEDFCESLIRSWQGRGLSDIPQLLQCMDRFFQDNLYSISTEPSFYRDLVFCFYHLLQKEDVPCRYILILLVAGAGIEPATSRLWAWRATTALPRDLNSRCKSTNIFRKRKYYEEKNSE